MTRWIESRSGDLGLRVGGGALLLFAFHEAGVLQRLVHIQGNAPATGGELLLAALLFLSISFGSALLILGHHIGDRITLPARWSRRFPSDEDRP